MKIHLDKLIIEVNEDTGKWILRRYDGKNILHLQDVRLLRDNFNITLDRCINIYSRYFSDAIGEGIEVRIKHKLFNQVLKAYRQLDTILYSLHFTENVQQKFKIVETEFTPWYALGPGQKYALADGYHSWELPLRTELKRGVKLASKWNIAMCNVHVGDCLVAGYLIPRKWRTNLLLQWNSDEPSLKATLTRDWENGNMPYSEVLALLYGEKWSNVLSRYAEIVASQAQVNIRKKVPLGWCSWYEYYLTVCEEEVLKNLKVAKELGSTVFQIDDGWERDIGDWYPNEKFPRGMKWLADRIRSEGMTPGIWIAPFIASSTSDLFKEHRDWFIKDDKRGEPKVIFRGWSGKEIYALDLTNPEVIKWIKETFYRISNEWGYKYIKIDFLHYATVDGVRYNNSISSYEAYRRALKCIRDTVGNDVYILGCGAPINISIGYVDGMRIGADITTDWNWIKLCTKYVARRFYMHGKYWHNDPDCIVVREPLTLNQAKVWTTIVALSGGLAIHSDINYKLPPERIEILEKAFPSSNIAAIPLDLFEKDVPEIWTIKIDEERMIIALINWAHSEKHYFIDISSIGLRGGKYLAHEFWEDKLFFLEQGTLLAKVEPTSCKVFHIRKYQARPYVISVNIHVLQGLVDILREEWNEGKLILKGSIRNLKKKNIVLSIYVPPGYIATTSSHPIEKHEDNIIKLKIKPDKAKSIDWHVKFKIEYINLLDYVENASWENNDGAIEYGSTDWRIGINIKSIERAEDDHTYTCLYMHPKAINNGFIVGWFEVTIPEGYKAIFSSKVGFKHGMSESDGVKFIVLIKDGEETIKLLEKIKHYSGKVDEISVELTQFSGRRIKLGLMVDSLKTPHYDHALWINPTIKFKEAIS